MPSKILVEQIAHTNDTSAIDIDSSGNMVLQKDLKLGSQGTIKNSAGNAILQESGGDITISNANLTLPASGGISDSSGNAILTESSGVTSLGSNVNFDSIANDSISGDKINGGTISSSTLASSCDVRSADGGIPTGTVMLFQQTNAPVGFTKLSTHNDKALRVTSGTVGTGGSVNFTTAFSRTATDGHSLSEAEIPSHNHDVTNKDLVVRTGVSLNDPWDIGLMSTNAAAWPSSSANPFTSDNTGSGNSHSHDIDIRVQYVDIILASKD